MQRQRTSSGTPHLRERGVAVLGLASGTAVAGTLACLLAVRVRDLVGAGGGAWRVEAAVELAVTGVGSLVAAWLAVSAAVALGCVLARLASPRTATPRSRRCGDRDDVRCCCIRLLPVKRV